MSELSSRSAITRISNRGVETFTRAIEKTERFGTVAVAIHEPRGQLHSTYRPLEFGQIYSGNDFVVAAVKKMADLASYFLSYGKPRTVEESGIEYAGHVQIEDGIDKHDYLIVYHGQIRDSATVEDAILLAIDAMKDEAEEILRNGC